MKKRLLTTLAVLCLAVFAFAQAPQKMNYQALVKDANNTAVAMQAVGAQVTLLQAGTAVYSETHTVTTDTNAIMALEMDAVPPEDVLGQLRELTHIHKVVLLGRL